MENKKEFDDIKGEEDNINVMSLVDIERLKIKQSSRPLVPHRNSTQYYSDVGCNMAGIIWAAASLQNYVSLSLAVCATTMSMSLRFLES